MCVKSELDEGGLLQLSPAEHFVLKSPFKQVTGEWFWGMSIIVLADMGLSFVSF